jgi:orotidine-5'-phosphate decarboxylase
MEARDRLFLALDVSRYHRAKEIVTQLQEYVGGFKVGSQLFTQVGPRILHLIKKVGKPIFLDLKYHDIPATVARAAEEAVRHGVSIFNIHTSGGYEMMRACVDACKKLSREKSLPKPLILGVTLLTSLTEADLNDLGIQGQIKTQVLTLARMAQSAGLDGVIASPQEAKTLREDFGKDFIILCPGVRPAGFNMHDHRRSATPKEAIEAGANYIVVGRPVLEAPDPASVCQRLIQEIKEALSQE